MKKAKTLTNLLIISHAKHYLKTNHFYAYEPLVREMNIWLKHVDQVEILAPLKQNDFDSKINAHYKHHHIKFTTIPEFSILNIKEILFSILKIPSMLIKIYHAMKRADHIHLRCPGNLALLGCMVQILFPSTPKTAKYAGNWDPKAKQPRSYNLQKWILSNTLLTKNIDVLVYGNWPNQTKNIKPFFTATYYSSEIEELYIRNYTKALHFCYVGTLSPGKQPIKALELVNQLRQQGLDAVLHFYGDGELKGEINKQITQLNAENWAFVYGNQPKDKIKKALKYSHFLILLSQSEGWPKAVAEAMFWGCIPVTSGVSCLPWMLDQGKRGILITNNPKQKEIDKFINLLSDTKALEQMSKEAYLWSTQYTLDKFEDEISKLLTKQTD